MKPIISVRNLSKKYIIGENISGRGARTFRDIFDYKTRRLFRKDVNRRKEDTTIWALKNVSFDVDQGEVVGIIGCNGAGKSTLLKILSRITEPTEGDVTLRGRVASLLEVGTGFSGELTGRENIFLNGSILGMKKKEIKQKFDEIVAFAEVEKFIDTPVKRYSSGMYVRLAFAVAANLEPEILLVDEVLSVGDVAFQKKCLGRMGNVAKEGRTVLFVSHNMAAIARLCEKVIWLNEGKIIAQGLATDIISRYLSSQSSANARWECSEHGLLNSARGRILSATVGTLDENNIHLIDFSATFAIELVYQILQPMRFTAGFRLRNEAGLTIFVSSEGDTTDWGFRTREPGIYNSRVVIPGGMLSPGSYFLTFGLYVENVQVIDRHEDALSFEISASGSPVSDGRDGVITPILTWEVRRNGNTN